jgi:cob(I)alamin adenosyltransferase
MAKDNIYLWTGEGAGKTTSALGVALRSAGWGKKVVVVQFMKGRQNIGEYKVMKKLAPFYKVYQFGAKSFIRPINKPRDIDREKAQRGLEFCYQMLYSKKLPFLLILDEVNLACSIGLLKSEDIIDFLDKVPASTIVYLTGRRAPKGLIAKADFVNEIVMKKAPKIYPVRKGIEY